MKYRADIDGLRAIAVLAITVFHLRTAAFTGGYVGVDIFYVISGFLIGGNVFAQQSAGFFSIREFYFSRFRRIVPALVVMLLTVTAAALFLLYPTQLVEYAYALIAAALSLSNVYFWTTTDYFSPSAFELPLLHTWSLGVEEQFYLLFPPLVIWLSRWPARSTNVALWSIAAASLVLSAIGIMFFPQATFYLLPTRIWEILLGTVLTRTALPQLDRRIAREIVATVGAALIVGSVLFFTDITPFPGLTALVPCVGTAAVIAAGRAGPSLAGRVLSWRPLVFVGLISYSLYLWHWPVIVLLQRALLEPNLVGGQKAVALVLSFALATASWWLVERPFRKAAFSVRTIYRGTATSLGAVTVLGLTMVAANGLPQRFTPQVASVAAFLGHKPDRWQADLHCYGPTLAQIVAIDHGPCLARSPGTPNVLILGDSHAAHLWWGLSHRYPHIHFLEATASGCKPTLSQMPRAAVDCTALMTHVLRNYLPANKPALVLISAHWDMPDQAPLQATLKYLHKAGVRVAVSGPISEYNLAIPFLLAQQIERRDPTFVERHQSKVSEQVDGRIGAVARHAGVSYISLYQFLCSHHPCVTEAAPGVPLQFDTSHLTDAGSIRVADAFAPVMPMKNGIPLASR